MSKFTISATVEEAIANFEGRASINVEVEGFWSNPITIYINRDWNGGFSADVSHSSGGYERDYDNLEASLNFGYANIAAVEFAREVIARTDELEASYEKYRERLAIETEERRKIMEEKRRIEAIEQAKKEAVDAPYILGVEGATRLVEKMAKNSNVSSYFRRAGEELDTRYGWNKGISVECSTTFTGRKSYYIGDRRIAKDKLIAKLSRMVMTYQDLPWSYFAK